MAKRSTRDKERTGITRPPGAQELSEYVVAQLFGATSTQQPDDLRAPQRTMSAEARTAALRLKSTPPIEETALPHDVRGSTEALTAQAHRSHGAKVTLAWFPWRRLASEYADKFGYLTPVKVRRATSLPFNPTTVSVTDRLGGVMGDPARETAGDAAIPAGFTYAWQFVDHDITFEVSSPRRSAPAGEDPQHATGWTFTFADLVNF